MAHFVKRVEKRRRELDSRILYLGKEDAPLSGSIARFWNWTAGEDMGD